MSSMNRWIPAGVLRARNVRNSEGVNPKLSAFLFEREFREPEKRESVLINFVSFVLRQLPSAWVDEAARA